jgi:hypothetical protein
MSNHSYTLPTQPTVEERAKAILDESRSQKLIGKITNFGRRGARHIQTVILAAGVITHNGQPVRMTYDKIAGIQWQPA